MWRCEYLREISDSSMKAEIREILCQCDEEFFPPLSSRNSTSQSKLNTIGDRNSLDLYFAEMIKQNYILCKNTKKIL